MKTIADTSTAPWACAGSGWITGVARVLQSCRNGCSEWWAQRKAAAQLRALSDRSLRDIGLSRADINLAVKGVDVRHRPLDFAEKRF